MAYKPKPPEEKKKSGRPIKTEVEPHVANAICQNLEMGMSLDLSAQAEGVGERTLQEWMERFPDFSARVTRSRGLGAKFLHSKSIQGGPGSSNALWHLERRFPKQYMAPRHEAEKSTEIKVVIEGGLPSRPK